MSEKRWFLLFFIGTLLVFTEIGTQAKKMDEERKSISVFDVQSNNFIDVQTVVKTDDEWRAVLTKEQFYVVREQGTERPFTYKDLKNKNKGIYKCIACGNDLFLSEAKFESGTGWPSFFKPVAEENVGVEEDSSLVMNRTEVHCSKCGAHLGHIFSDGPPPTNLRYCINGVSLEFVDQK